ncbi:hypothetical protein [Caryophanon latum]|uniref:MalT-like TPR region domain-containing protein n=1 Tax=Caryophanon latum TaxID=33977 RepID=A0A1C0YRB7_9BACL|nr:hypothetical protein [Caryophanon latum]OCS89693.1 hypothetical protein A6K76_12260 [Caryophanon latum]
MEFQLHNDLQSIVANGRFTEAYRYVEQLLQEATRTNNLELQLTGYIQRLTLHLQLQHFEAAATDLHICEQLMNEHEAFKIYESLIYYASGTLNALTNNPQVAHTQFSHAISIAYERGEWLTLSAAYTKMSLLPQIHSQEAINLARTGVLFAKVGELKHGLYVTRALLTLTQIYLQAAQVDDALALCDELQQLLEKHPYIREQLYAETIMLHYYVFQQQFEGVIEKGTALLEKLQQSNEYDLYAQALSLVIQAFEETNQLERIPMLKQQYEAMHDRRQQQSFKNELNEQAPSHFDGLKAFKKRAEQFTTQHDGYALLLFFIESEKPLPYEETSVIFNLLHTNLQKTNLTFLAHNMFETHKMLYVVKETFDEAALSIEQAITNTVANVEQPIHLLFGHAHNVEHETYSFSGCLALCHAYLYYKRS